MFQNFMYIYAGVPVAFKTLCGHNLPPLVEIGLRWLPKLGVDASPRPHAHRRACCLVQEQKKVHMKGILTNQK